MVAGVAAYPDVVFLGDRVFLRYYTLSCLFVELDAATEVFFSSETEVLTIVQGQVCVDIDFERSSKTLVLFFNEDCETVAASFGCKHLIEIVESHFYQELSIKVDFLTVETRVFEVVAVRIILQ